MTKTAPLITFALALLAPFSSVFATTSEWAVVPAASGDLPVPMQNLVVEIGQELERQGRRVWPPTEATTLFERKVSAEPVALSDQALERWLEDSRAGIRTLALGQHEAALRHLRRASQMSRAALTALNREDERAQRVLDTCLFLVRALLETGEHAGAEDQARECAFLAPGGEPQDLLHPPTALALFEEARREGAVQNGKLVVDGDRKDCTVRINGRRVGRTPFETSNLNPGVYAVQVECNGQHPGRIYSARTGVGATRLRIDTSIDRIVRTDPMLRLDAPGEAGSTTREAAAHDIAAALPAQWVVLVSQLSSDTIELDLVGTSVSRMGCARIKLGTRGVVPDTLAITVRNVIAGKCRDPSAVNAPAPTAPGTQALSIQGI